MFDPASFLCGVILTFLLGFFFLRRQPDERNDVTQTREGDVTVEDDEKCSECKRDGCPRGCRCWCHGKAFITDE